MSKAKLPGTVTKAYGKAIRRPLGKGVWYYTISLLAFYLVIHWTSYNNVAAFCYLLFAVGVALTFIRMSWGFYFYLVVSMLGDDTLQIRSTHLTAIGPFTVTIYWTLFMLFMMVSCYLKKPKLFKVQKFDKYMFGIAALFAVAGIVGLGNLLDFPREYISDLSYMVNMAIAYFFVRIWIRKEEQLRRLISLIIISYGVKAATGVVFYHLGIGLAAGPNLRVIYESGRVILGTVFFLCLSMLFYLPKMKPGHKALLLLFALSILFHLISFGSRGNIILTCLGLLFFLTFSWVNGHRRIAVKTVAAMALSVILCLVSINTMRTGAVRNVMWKLRSLRDYDPAMLESFDSISVASRIMEAMNIFYTELHTNSLVWGRGLGGWFSDEKYPFSETFIVDRAFPIEQFMSRKFTKPHSTPLVLFLKTGIGGLLVYYFTMLLFFRGGYILFRSIGDKYWEAVVLGIVVALPFFFYKNFMSKLQIFLGVALGILANIWSLKANAGILQSEAGAAASMLQDFWDLPVNSIKIERSVE